MTLHVHGASMASTRRKPSLDMSARRSNKPLQHRLYYCAKCDTYFDRFLGWSLAANHVPIAMVPWMGRTQTPRCLGPAKIVRKATIAAAYRMGGKAAVSAMLPEANWG